VIFYDGFFWTSILTSSYFYVVYDVIVDIKTTKCQNRCPKKFVIKNQGLSKKHGFLLVSGGCLPD